MEIIQTNAGRLVAGMVVPALCVDLDGTIRYSKSGDFIQGPEDIALYPEVERILWEYRDRDYLIFGISNQGGVAYGFKTLNQNEAEIDATLALFSRNPFHILKTCLHHEKGMVSPWNVRSLLRKPSIGMLVLCEVEAFAEGYIVDWDRSVFVGDRTEDRACAENAGIEFREASDFFQHGEGVGAG
jgi:D-glycero-D-manno-heptose 1,7-bisphosphate phosphatase